MFPFVEQLVLHSTESPCVTVPVKEIAVWKCCETVVGDILVMRLALVAATAVRVRLVCSTKS
jgi:hypothetical protein